jgi:hypothetical protein
MRKMISAIDQGSRQQMMRRRLSAASRLAGALDELEPGGQHVERAPVLVVVSIAVELVGNQTPRLLAHVHGLEAGRVALQVSWWVPIRSPMR